MTKQIWINLPVKNIALSKQFFTQLGFSFDSVHGNTDVSACMQVGDKQVVVMLFAETFFQTFTQHTITDTSKSTEILLSLDAESKIEVDEFAQKVAQAGGTVLSQPTEIQGWMYGFAFADLDGHRWNVVYMDISKMPQC